VKSPATCEQFRDRIRYALSDTSGILRFKDFEIVDAPECLGAAKAVRQLVNGTALEEIDVDALLHRPCPANGQCMRAIAGLIRQSQDLFVHATVPQSTASPRQEAGAGGNASHWEAGP
jgi:hypothetical protein